MSSGSCVLFGLGEVLMKWMPVILLVIGILIVPLAVVGYLMWGVSQQDELRALSTVFIFVGVALSISAGVWLAIWGRRKPS